MTRARGRLRPGRRGGGDDRRDQLLPRVRLRPAGRERADPRVDVRRGDRRAPRRPPRADHRRQSARWSTSPRRSSRPPRAPQLTSPPPISTYGFQKLASEYFAKGAWEQYQLPYTIVRPFNCVGIGERRARPRHRHHERQREAGAAATSCPTSCTRSSRARTRSTSWATGDQVRHYTYGGDLAHGIRLAMESPAARQRRLQPLDRGVDDGARAGRGDLAQGPRRRPAVPLRQRPAVRARRPAARPGRPQGARGARLRGDDLARRRCSTRSSRGSARKLEAGTALMTDARRSRSSCPSSRKARRSSPCSGRSTRGVATPHEILVVYDFDEDPTVPGHRAAAAELPAVRGLRNDLGRGVLNAMKAGHRRVAGAVRPDLDGRRLRRAARRRSDGRARARRRGRRLGVALHARRPPDRRAAAQAADEPDRRADAPLVRRRRRPTTRPTTSSSTRAASSTRSTIESTAGFELALELTVKATIAGRRVAEVPTTWRDRTAGAEQLQAPQVAAALPALVLGGLPRTARPDRRVERACALGRLRARRVFGGIARSQSGGFWARRGRLGQAPSDTGGTDPGASESPIGDPYVAMTRRSSIGDGTSTRLRFGVDAGRQRIGRAEHDERARQVRALGVQLAAREQQSHVPDQREREDRRRPPRPRSGRRATGIVGRPIRLAAAISARIPDR